MAIHVMQTLLWVTFSLGVFLAFSPLHVVRSQATTSPPVCSTGWELHNGFCYNVQYRYHNIWELFRRGCLNSDAEIASIRSTAEQAFVMSYLTRALRTTYQAVYIGLTATSGKPKWEDRRPVNYTNWASRQPSYTNGPDCAYINYNNNVDRGQWYVTSCSYNYISYALCKRSAACQEGWFYNAKRCYKYMSSGLNWATASNTCKQTYASQLVSIGSANEQAVIDYWLWVRAGVSSSKWLWIGLNDIKVETQLEWSDGTPLTYKNWLPAHPYQASNLDCTQMYKYGGALGAGNNGQWKLQDCSHFSLPYVCEKQADTSIVPVEDRGEFEIITDLPKPQTDSSLHCSSGSMTYALKKTIAPPSLYEIPYLMNDTCLAADNGTHYTFVFDFDDCGTEIIHYQGDLYFLNTIFSKALHSLPGAPVNADAHTIPKLVDIKLQCKFNKEVGVTTYEARYGYIINIAQSPVFNVTGLGLFSPSMNVFTANNFSEPVKKGVTKVYRLNQRAYFEIRVTSDKRLSVRARECWVNVGKHDEFPKAFVLRNGCPVSGNVAGLTSHSSPGSSAHRLSYRVFGMTGYENSIQYFHCTALVCSATDPTAFCNKGCDDARRRRRAVKIIDVPDRNSNFTFTTPGFFVNPNSESSVADISATTMASQRLLILFSTFVAYLFCSS